MCAKIRSEFMSYSDIEALGESQLRKTYRDYQRIFSKRVERLAAAGYGNLVRPYRKGGFNYIPSISKRKTTGMTKEEKIRDLRMGVKELVTLLTGGDSASVGLSISAIKKTKRENDARIRDAFKASGFKHVSRSMVKKFGRFMDAMRAEYGKKLPNSDMMVAFFDSLKYETKRMSLDKIVDLWHKYEANGYAPSEDNIDLFRT